MYSVKRITDGARIDVWAECNTRPLCSSTRATPLKIITTARLSVHTLIGSYDALRTKTRPFISFLMLRERKRACQNHGLLSEVLATIALLSQVVHCRCYVLNQSCYVFVALSLWSAAGEEAFRDAYGAARKQSVASTSALVIPGSRAECPASEITCSAASGHALYNSQALIIGHTTSYRPCTITAGMERILPMFSIK